MNLGEEFSKHLHSPKIETQQITDDMFMSPEEQYKVITDSVNKLEETVKELSKKNWV